MTLKDKGKYCSNTPCDAHAEEDGGCDSAFADVEDAAVEEENGNLDHGNGEGVRNQTGVDGLAHISITISAKKMCPMYLQEEDKIRFAESGDMSSTATDCNHLLG